MAREELVSMLVGAGAGYLIGSAGKATGTKPLQCPECLSIPLYNQYQVPTPILDDYLFTKEWGIPNERKIKDFWNANLLTDGTNFYSIVFWYNIDTGIITIEAKRVYPTPQNIGTLQVPGTLSTQNGIISIDSTNARMIIDTVNYTVNSILTTPSINITQTGKPFKFNDGNDGIVIPSSWYLNGMEFPGTAIGTIGATNLTGLGVLERLNWNFDEFSEPGYRWIAFATGDGALKGILSRIGLYQDGGVWYNNTYFKVRYLDINITSRTPENWIGNLDVIAALDNNSGTEYSLILKLNKIAPDPELGGIRSYYLMSAYVNGAQIGNGLAWQDHSGV